MKAEIFLMGLLTSSAPAGLIFLIAGKIMQWHPPGWPNYFYGYRTMASLKTKESFDAANVFSAALMVKYGSRLIAWGLFIAAFFREQYWWVFLIAGMGAVIASVILLIIKTEKYLLARFGKNQQPLR